MGKICFSKLKTIMVKGGEIWFFALYRCVRYAALDMSNSFDTSPIVIYRDKNSLKSLETK